MTPRLADAVAADSGSLLHPSRERAAAPEVCRPLQLDAALDLGRGRWVAVVSDAAASRWTVPLVEEHGAVRRAVAGDGVAEALVAHICAAPTADAPFVVQQFAGAPVTGERAVTVDQTNESVVVGEAAIVKWMLRLPPIGAAVEHPAPRRLAALAAAGFDGTPPPWGVLGLDVGEAAPLTLAAVTGHLPGALDGWDWAVDDVRRFCRGELTEEQALGPPARLGGLTAGMHAALAAVGRTAATGDDVRRWAARALADLEHAVRSIDGTEGARLSAAAPRVAAGLVAFTDAAGTPLIDVHGDLHVGQVLRHGSPPSYAVTDFDGNPVLPDAERAARQPAALDVAGMMASLDHVGRVVVRRVAGVDAALVERWMVAAQGAFLDAYRRGLVAAGMSELLDERLLRPLRLQQECREFLYAAQHLPAWRYVPDQALAALLRSTDE